jgi:hypothetical protein
MAAAAPRPGEYLLAHVIYSREFFELQLRFADAVAGLSGADLAEVLLEYTNFYIRFGLGRAFDPAHPVWQAYLAGLRDASDRAGWTHRFCAARPEAPAPPALVATVGCFSYSRAGDDRIRLHFQNAEAGDHSPLAADRQTERRADLAALFAHVRRTTGFPQWVLGTSWLYNLNAYGRLFPASYLASARVAHNRFRHMPLWGQFLDRRGQLRDGLAHEFLARLARQSSLADLHACFPFQVLAVEAPARDFFEFYGV